MLFYWGVWAIVLLLALMWREKYYAPGYKILFVLFVIIALITGGREHVGADWESYQTYYVTGYAYDKVSGKVEPLFGLIRTVCYGLGCSYGFFCFVCCFISLCILHKAIKLMGVRNCFLAFLVYLSLFFCNYQFNIIRHGLLASFMLLAMAHLSKKNKWKAAICVLMGCGFQIMGLIFIPLLFFIDKCLSKKAIIIIISVSFVLYLGDLSGRIISAFPVLAAFDRLASYVDPDQDDVYKLSIGILGFLAIAIYSIIIIRKDYEDSTIVRIMANMVLLGFVIFCVLNGFSALVQRIGNILNLGIVILLPYIWQRLQKTQIRVLSRVIIITYLALYYPKSWNFSNEEGDYPMLPFKTEITNLL